MNFSQEIIAWYLINKRDLPWRETSDPYIIWLSEIIMQQTRVEQGTPYFHKFAEKYPTVTDFARASEDEILKNWQGLGYYSRGRNMHHTARMVMEEHAGYFPKKYDELLKLKGIGDYTAAAISSFSSNEPKAVVDGNVFRLLSRFFGIDSPINSTAGKKAFTTLANQVMDVENAGTYNQAAMEFGSLQCRPVRPDCSICPLRQGCEAYQSDRVRLLPVKLKPAKLRNRYFYFIAAVKGDRILMQKRGPKDIWQNLYQLPLFETESTVAAHEILNDPRFRELFGTEAIIKSISPPVKQSLSHQRLHSQFIEIRRFQDPMIETDEYLFANCTDLQSLAQPKLIFEFLEKFL
ncbi:A/G-specific adenine glycosylase [Flavihumibacter sp. R14]|nr:A/G-specific adenine glycosylase [Flavihumibacter soli]